MPNLITRLKILYKNHLITGRIVLVTLSIITILIIIRIALSPTIIYSTTSWLKKQNIDSTIESINISLYSGTVSLINAKGSRDGKPLFNIGRVDIDWQWAPLSDKTIEISKLALDEFNVGIEQFADKIIVGGVHFPLNSTVASADDSNEITRPWAATLGEVVFTDLNICYLQHTSPYEQASDENKFVDYCINLDEISWAGTISYATDETISTTDQLPVSSRGNFLLKGVVLTDNKLDKKLLTSQSNSLENVVVTGLNNIHIDRLNMNDFSAMQRDDKQHIDAVRFQQFSLDDINLVNLNALSVNSISIAAPGLYLVKPDQTSWEYQQWLPDTAINDKSAGVVANKQDSHADPFKIAIDNINVSDADFCYSEITTSLYYCFTLEQLKWTGAINYQSITSDTDKSELISAGELTLLHPNIYNHIIKRNLVDFQTLTMSGIKVKDPDNIKLSNITLTELAALQRGSDESDNTLAFKKLTINNVIYTADALAIDTIKLDDLSNSLSRNKDGEWEHNKWLPAKTRQAPDDQSVTAESDPKKPLVISLNRLNINSTEKISFTDNTTSPALNVGLQELLFEIGQLHADKPNTDSPVKLHAKTTRHSTIDIEGTVRPFAEKVSLDATGKLKGFDLRAATPATQKAIGHIIKSGQLDADLQLRAVEGILDSNIALSLYQFKIKPMSDRDAAKLDKQFGMPLNQTLVLLRDKDDSIHLDIPITGDINNPDFNPMDAIIKATSKAATVTLITFYTPYGLIYAGSNVLFDLATAMNFDPIRFNPGASEILSENRKQLDNLAKLLTEKPQIHLTLCGITNQEDVAVLFPENKQQKDGSIKPLTDKQMLALETLAIDRQTNSKNYLIKEGNLEHDRLILCSPEHKTDKDAIPGVEINI